MLARDPHRFINELDDAAVERLVGRLESRARDAVFTALFDKYANALALPAHATVLEAGCGTGAMLRRLARRDDFGARALGVDHCPAFVEAAARFARAEGISDRVSFRVGDAHALAIDDESFDAVIAHTLISHVSDPRQVLLELARVVRRGGKLVVFDGDYASMTFAHEDQAYGRRMDAALVSASFNNPMIMREMARLLPLVGMKLVQAWGDAVVEVGHASYFRSFIETYAPYVTKAGLAPADAVEAWLDAQRAYMDRGTFFGACNYYTFIATRSP